MSPIEQLLEDLNGMVPVDDGFRKDLRRVTFGIRSFRNLWYLVHKQQTRQRYIFKIKLLS